MSPKGAETHLIWCDQKGLKLLCPNTCLHPTTLELSFLSKEERFSLGSRIGKQNNTQGETEKVKVIQAEPKFQILSCQPEGAFGVVRDPGLSDRQHLRRDELCRSHWRPDPGSEYYPLRW